MPAILLWSIPWLAMSALTMDPLAISVLATALVPMSALVSVPSKMSDPNSELVATSLVPSELSRTSSPVSSPSRTSTERTWLLPISGDFTCPLMMSSLPIVSAA